MNSNVKLYNIQQNGRCMADVEILGSNTIISGLKVVPGVGGNGVIVHMPKEMGTHWTYTEIEWSVVREAVSKAYKENPQILDILQELYENNKLFNQKENNMTLPKKSIDLNVNCYNFDNKGNCMASIVLPKSKSRVMDFKVMITNETGISVYMPKIMKTRWSYQEVSWETVRKAISEKYKKNRQYVMCLDENREDTNLKLSIKEDSGIKEEIINVKEKNELGRILNAENSSFAFVPHTVLQLVPVKKNEKDKRSSMEKVADAINNKNTGGIGIFEVEVLDWISKLKYVSKTMIMDLVLSGYIALGTRTKISASKAIGIINRLQQLDLIDLTRFVAVDDEGNQIDDNKHSIMRICTIGKTGYTLLKELGRHPERRNPFGVLADGNTVKKTLAANQWIVYWLSHYDRDSVLDYSTSQIINLIGSEWNGARVYATINLETRSMIAEPVRRCEEFEKENEKIDICEKFIRMVDMFDNMDKLYTGNRDLIVYPSRPIITYLCEDNAHMKEVADILNELLKEYYRQEVWFSTDLRVFNYEMVGHRFKKCVNEEFVDVDLYQELSVNEMSMEERRML